MKQVGAWAFFPVLVMSVVPAVTAAVAQEAVPPRSIALATASPGGVYLVYGQALAPILSRALQIEVTAEPTQGAVHNVILLEKRQTMLAFVNIGPSLQGWYGTDWAKGTHYRSMRVMFPLYDTAFQFVAHKRVPSRSTISRACRSAGVRAAEQRRVRRTDFQGPRNSCRRSAPRLGQSWFTAGRARA